MLSLLLHLACVGCLVSSGREASGRETKKAMSTVADGSTWLMCNPL